MKQLVASSNISINGNTVTLIGVSVPLSQILLISDATTGSVLYSIGGPAPISYTQGTNSSITLNTTPGSSDALTIYYDDGIAPVNAPTSVSVLNFPATQAVSGMVTVSNPQTTVSVSNFPSTQAVSVSALPLPSGAATSANQTTAITSLASIDGKTPTLNADGGSPVHVNNFPATQTVSGTVGISGTVPVSGTFWPATQPVSALSLPLPSGAAQDGTDGTGITAPTGGSGIRGWLSGIYQKLSAALAVSQSGTWTTGRTWNLASSTDTVTAAISGTVPVSGTFWQTTQPVNGTVTLAGGSATIGKVGIDPANNGVAISGTIPVSGSVGVSSLPANLGTTSLAPAYASITNFPSSQAVSGTVTLGAGSAAIGSVSISASSSSSPSTFTSTSSNSILASNSSRKGIVLSSPSANTGICYVTIGTTTTSSTAFSFLLNPGDIISLTGINNALTGIWSTSGNTLYVTELS